MSLNAKQAEFTRTLGQFLVKLERAGIEVILAEAYRTPEQAELYAKAGKGIKNSNHCKKLAVDLFRVKDGRVTWNRHHYVQMGRIWKQSHPDARWGGEFRNRDCVHFSFEHQGRA